ncbi:acyltransferase family protein [Ponticaulis sp.]|uniref:acyltransferase family protein n=1 Tax=Ponticaulis sp. TaxID=2020902 RepID=UPI0025DEF083|nr:acyltransferase family protein [Ponticaulis sp.]
MQKRSDIQYLRALAVLVVIVFHLSERVLPYGFLGVDIFFVISGYVITRSVFLRQDAGAPFSIRSFFARRYLRLMPALFLNIGATLIAALILYPPEDLISVAMSAVYAVFGFSNIWFFTQTDYFAAPLETMPLLHTWSLGVEEQFYLGFAFVSALAFYLTRRVKHLFLYVWAGLSTCSLIFTFAGAGLASSLPIISNLDLNNADAAFRFFMLPARIYQFGLGIIGAYLVLHTSTIRKIPPLTAAVVWSACTVSALLLVLIGPVLLVSADVIALLVSITIAVAICAAEYTKLRIPLAHNLLHWIGDRSYSLYLVHWPIIVFAAFYVYRPFNGLDYAVLTILTFAAGALSHYLAERKRAPAGKPEFISQRKWRSYGVFAGIAILIPASLFIAGNDGLPFRMAEQPPSEYFIYDRAFSEEVTRIGEGPRREQSSFRVISPSGGNIAQRVLVLGDSHANHLRPMGEYFASTYGVEWTTLHYPGCPPIFGTYKIYGTETSGRADSADNCERHTARIETYVREHGAEYDYVILSARWNWMFDHDGFQDVDIRHDALVTAAAPDDHSIEASKQNFIDGLDRTIRAIRDTGARPILFTQPPVSRYPVAYCDQVPGFLFNAQAIQQRCSTGAYGEIMRRGAFVTDIARSGQTRSGAEFESLIATDFLCDETQQRCFYYKEGARLFDDDSHYNVNGSLYLARQWESMDSFPFRSLAR